MTAGRFNHVGGDGIEKPPDFKSRLLQHVGESGRERAVAACAVLGDLPRLGGVNDEDTRRRIGRRQPPIDDGAGVDGPLHSRGEGIIAAGVQDDQPQLVGAGDLDTVARVIDKGPIGLIGLVAEASQRLEHGDAVRILNECDLEALATQRRRHQGRVILRVGQCAHPGVGGIADDQGDPAVRECRVGQAKPEKKEGDPTPHGLIPNKGAIVGKPPVWSNSARPFERPAAPTILSFSAPVRPSQASGRQNSP